MRRSKRRLGLRIAFLIFGVKVKVVVIVIERMDNLRARLNYLLASE